jgi:hypothetical protein
MDISFEAPASPPGLFPCWPLVPMRCASIARLGEVEALKLGIKRRYGPFLLSASWSGPTHDLLEHSTERARRRPPAAPAAVDLRNAFFYFARPERPGQPLPRTGAETLANGEGA